MDRMVSCMICGKNIAGQSCQMCGAVVCSSCFDSSKGVCKACSAGKRFKR